MMHRLPNKEYMDYFKSLQTIAVPKPLRLACTIIILSLILTFLVLLFTPWVQTSYGRGMITALHPEDRLQSINAPLPGRIAKWYVQDGAQVKKGAPIVEIVDNDPNLYTRLEAERDAVASKLDAVQSAVETARIDYNRQKDLFEKGLSARKDFELAAIKLEQLNADMAAAKAELNKAEVQLDRQSTQLVRAPRDGTVLNINAGDTATFVKSGDILADFFPKDIKRAVELYISGLDAPLIYPGRKVRLIFEGWPAVQFSGWPSVAVGTFAGVVTVVDPTFSPNGQIRILVTETESTEEAWPDKNFLRYGARTRGWVLLDTVPLGYELWRQLNNFPPEFSEQTQPNSAQDLGG